MSNKFFSFLSFLSLVIQFNFCVYNVALSCPLLYLFRYLLLLLGDYAELNNVLSKFMST